MLTGIEQVLSPLRLLLLAFVLTVLPPVSPAGAQEAAPPATAESADDVMKPLLDVLKDDAARARLIESLEKSTAPAAPGAAAGHRPTVVDGLAVVTKDAIDQAVGVGRRFFDDLSGIASLFSGRPGEGADFSALSGPLLLTIAASLIISYGGRWVFRSGAGHLARRMGERRGLFAAIARVGAYFLAEALALGLAYFGAGALAATAFGAPGVSIFETLYLNAFLVFGVTAIFLRLLTGIVNGGYPLLRFSPAVCGQIRWRGIVLAGILVYGIAFVVPAINNFVSFTAGRSLRVIVYTLAAIFAVLTIRAISAAQRAEPPRMAPEDVGDEAIEEALPQPVHSAFLRIWPLIGYLYVAASYVIALSRPDIFMEFVGGATLKTVVALVAGGLVMRLFGYLSMLTVRTPDFLPLDGPALSARLASILPFCLRVLWLIVAIVVVAAILDAWAVIDVSGWIASDRGGALVDGIVSGLIVILAIAVVWALATSWIDHRMQNADVPVHNQSRHRTLYSLLSSAVTVALVIFGGMIALSELGVDIGPLLAGAGVLGLAIGFGSQKLVQDIISGIFIQLENAMNVGDVVSAGGITGSVERLTLRSVALRDLSGVFHIIPFSSVDLVSNFMRLFSYHVEQVGIAYKESVADGKAAMQEAFDRLMQTEHRADILEPLEMHGVTALGDSAVMIRARIKTAPGKQFALGRAYTELVKQVMDEHGIEIPFPHTTLVLGRDKQGRPDEIAIDIKPTDSRQTEPDETK